MSCAAEVLSLDRVNGETRRRAAAAMAAHSVSDDEQPPARLALRLFLRGSQSAEVLIFRADLPDIGLEDRLDDKASSRQLRSRTFGHIGPAGRSGRVAVAETVVDYNGYSLRFRPLRPRFEGSAAPARRVRVAR